jgi:IS30 family transposase
LAKGTNKNNNELNRRFFPKGTDFIKVTEKN